MVIIYESRGDKIRPTQHEAPPPITSLRIKPLRDIDLTLKKQCTHPFIQGFPTASTFKVVREIKIRITAAPPFWSASILHGIKK